MQIPPGAQAGQKLRLRGRGLPGKPPGEQYVQLKVVLPPANSAAAKAVYEEMRAKLAFDLRELEVSMVRSAAARAPGLEGDWIGDRDPQLCRIEPATVQAGRAGLVTTRAGTGGCRPQRCRRARRGALMREPQG
jgi:hypothetical protein